MSLQDYLQGTQGKQSQEEVTGALMFWALSRTVGDSPGAAVGLVTGPGPLAEPLAPSPPPRGWLEEGAGLQADSG